MKLKRKSWHWKLATYSRPFSPLHDRHSTDICSYTKAVAGGALIVAVHVGLAVAGTFLAAAALVAMGSVIGWFATGMEGGWNMPPDLVRAGLPLWLAVILASGAATFNACKSRRRPAPPPGFLKLAWRSWRGKFCIKIDLE